MDLPKALVSHAQTGRVVLFLTASTERSLRGPKGQSSPSLADLSRFIATEFLDSSFVERPLAEVVDLATSESGLPLVQEKVAALYNPLEPDEAHFLLPKFHWAAIASTCIHIATERAYDRTPDKVQRCAPFKRNGESVEKGLGSSEAVMFLKLHGCITSTRDPELPLILTPEQYPTHKRNRSHLFERLESLAYEYPILFFGQSPSDPDLRASLIFLTNLPHPRPRSYLVLEDFTSADERMWGAKNITCLKGSFLECLKALDQSVSQNFRKLAALVPSDATPLARRVRVQGRFIPSPSLTSFLENDVEFIHETFAGGDCDPKAFYKGFFEDWAPIEKGLDVRRTIADDIASEAFFDEEDATSDRQQFYLISGHAGSGKSVLLKRLAWDAAKEYNKFCLFVRPSAAPQFEPLQELFSVCKERIFLFVDRVSDCVSHIETVMQRARAEGVTLTIIGATRSNTWSSLSERLESFLSGTFEMPYLDTKELDALISLLQEHDSIGSLDGLDRTQQRELLAKKSGRQLLVALLEATLGKPLSDIILDEFESIEDATAQSLYITTCILHRLNVPARAGLISRVHGIPYSEFSERLFKPLKYIVSAKKSERIQDYEYYTRHPYIAEVVFERVLDNSQDRFDEYVRILRALDTDYITDRDAVRGLTSARELLRLFVDFSLIRQVYAVAHARCPKDASIYQQEAIFEMNCGEGHLDVAAKLLRQAKELAPWNRSVGHSLAELALKRADASSSRLERSRLRQESKRIIADLKAHGRGTVADAHTLLKIHTDELKEELGEADPPAIERKIKELERMISEAHQFFPNDSYILDAEAKFLSVMGESPRALSALKKAFQANKRSTYLALTLAKTLEQQKEIAEAVRILQECLEANPLDKDIHFALAKLFLDMGGEKSATVTYHLRQSFTAGDSRHEAQFWYARQLYLNGDLDASYTLFRQLRSAAGLQRRTVRARITAPDGSVLRLSGSISRSEASSAKIRRDQLGDILVARASDSPNFNWRLLGTNRRVTFEIGFSLAGPTAVDLRLENTEASVAGQSQHRLEAGNVPGKSADLSGKSTDSLSSASETPLKTGNASNARSTREDKSFADKVPEMSKELHLPMTVRTRWKPEEILTAMSPKNMRGLYIVGSFDRRITLYNQQVRVLTLVRCLMQTGRLQQGHKVAVVGGGAAGLTGAAAAAYAGAEVTLYETAPVLLPRQRPAKHRYLHPHMYDWPAEHSRDKQAGLPLLDWTATTADAVVEQLLQGFENCRHVLGAEPRVKHTVKYLEQITARPGEPLIRLRATSPIGPVVEEYHVVVLTVGFEEDGTTQGSPPRVPGDDTPSYWVPDNLSHISGTRGTKLRILISGTGDGGLIDIARACIADFRHEILFEKLAGHLGLVQLAKKIENIDNQIRTQQKSSVGMPTRVFQEYMSLDVPQEVLRVITDLPQSHADVFLNYRDSSVFTFESALINRLIALLLIKSGRVELVDGKIQRIDAASGVKQVTLVQDDGRTVVLPFDRVFLRHGPDPEYIAKLFPKVYEDSRELGGKLAELGIGSVLDQDTLEFFEQLKKDKDVLKV